MVNLEHGFSGFIELNKTRKGVVTEERNFNNVLLHYGVTALLERMAGYDLQYPPWELCRYLFLGTGTKEPSLNDPGLLGLSNIPGKMDHSHKLSQLNDAQNMNRFAEVTLYFTYEEGEATGTWTELGLANNVDYTDIAINRALIRDKNGVPNPLWVEADEKLNVAVTLRISVGIQNPIRQELYLNQTEGKIPYTLKALDSVYWRSDLNHSVWRRGSPIGALVLLDREGNPITLQNGRLGKHIYDEPVIKRTYSAMDRLFRMDVRVPFTDNDVEIHGFAFGPYMEPEYWMFEATLDSPILKIGKESLHTEIVLAASIEYPTLPWHRDN